VLARLPFFDSDERIVAALLAGQREGGSALFDRYERHVKRVLIRVMGPDAGLSDLVQDVFLAAIDGIHRLEEPEALRGWLGGICVQIARAEIRRRTRRRWFPLFAPTELPDVPSLPPDVTVSEALRVTYRILDRIPADERIPFCLRHIDEMELAAVADACQVSLATAKRRIGRARERLTAMAKAHPELSEWLDGGET